MSPIDTLKMDIAKEIKDKFSQMNLSTTRIAEQCGVRQATFVCILKLAEGFESNLPRLTVEKLMLIAASLDIKLMVPVINVDKSDLLNIKHYKNEPSLSLLLKT